MDREKKKNNQQLQVKLNTIELKQVSSQKLLGVIIGQKLSFDDHINELCNKLCQWIAVLSKIKGFLPLEQKKAFYNPMIKQTMLYASNQYSPRAPLGIYRGFFVSRSEVHALSLTPTRQQTVMNCLRDWIGFPCTWRWRWTSVFRFTNVLMGVAQALWVISWCWIRTFWMNEITEITP